METVLTAMATTATRTGAAVEAELAHRPDIDGLRALSVILVIAYHFAAWSMPGGFIGVDVFFVISGYLISGLIFDRLRRDRFSLADFYARRFRRIMPALIVVVAVSLAIGCIILMPSDLREAARSGAYAVVGMSNFYFLQNTGYFDITAEMMPFLHTWSLGVEEQFYLVWPLVMWGLYRLTQGRIGPIAAIIALITVASLALNLLVAQQSPKHDFYLPFTRAWELGLGALLVFLPRLAPTRMGSVVAQISTLAGVVLVIGSGILLKNGLPYPGYYAIAPVTGAALLIYESGRPSLVRRLLSLPPVEFIGRISYSLYLWHWPVLVLWRHFNNGDAPTAIELPALIAVLLLLSWLSWRFVETPARQLRWRPQLVFASAAAAVVATCAPALAIVASNGLPNRLSPEARAMAGLDVMWAWSCRGFVTLPVSNFVDPSRPIPLCGFGADWAKAKRKMLLWGDSTAEHFIALLDDVGRRTDTAITLVNPCPALFGPGIERRYHGTPAFTDKCRAQQDSAIALLQRSPDITHVMLAARWSDHVSELHDGTRLPEALSPEVKLGLFEAGLAATIQKLAMPGRRIILVKDLPVVPTSDPAACYVSRIALPRARVCTRDLDRLAFEQLTTTQRQSHEALSRVAANFPGTIVVSPQDGLCENGRCRTQVAGEFIYRDNIHLRRNLKPETMSTLNRLIGFEQALATAMPNGKLN